MMTKRRPLLLGGLAAAVLGASLAAWQVPAGASGGPAKPPAAKNCVKPAPKDVKGIEAAKRADYAARVRPNKDGLTEAALKAKKAAEGAIHDKAGLGKTVEEKVGPAGGPKKDGCKPDGGIDLKALAREFKIPVARLEAGLVAAKRAGGGGEASVKAFAKAAGVSQKVAKAVIGKVFGDAEHQDRSRGEAAAAIAKSLGVSPAAAAKALERLNQAGGIEPDSALFKSVAHDLGVTPKQLNAALLAWKLGEGSKG
jgi:hypothetical protein